MKVLALIPAYNEEKTIGLVVQETLKYVDAVLVLDDGSTDNTQKISQEKGAKVFSNSVNLGLGLNMAKGYAIALEHGADLIVQLDADNQYDPSEIPKLIDAQKSTNADMVLGSRFLGNIESMPFLNRFGNIAFSKIVSMLSRQNITDSQTGFRVVTPKVVMLASPISRYTYTQEMVIKSIKENLHVVEVPITFRKRASGPSRLIGNLPQYAFNSGLIVLKLARDYYPLYFFGFSGLILICIGVLIGLFLIMLYLSTGSVLQKVPLTILSSLFLTSGSILFFLGLLADMISSSKREIKNLFLLKSK